MAKIAAVPSPARPKSKPVTTLPTREEIQLRAYEIYLERRGAPGDALEDWVRAEKELLLKPRRKGRKNSRGSKAA
jgi:hypothetical protein